MAVRNLDDATGDAPAGEGGPVFRRKTMSMTRLGKRERARAAAAYPEAADLPPLPATRADCPPPGADGRRVCTFLRCRAHLALEVNPRNGAIVVNAPFKAGADGVVEVDLEAMPFTCLHDATDAGGMTLEEVADVFGVVRERARQIEASGVAKLEAIKDQLAPLLEAVEDEPAPHWSWMEHGWFGCVAKPTPATPEARDGEGSAASRVRAVRAPEVLAALQAGGPMELPDLARAVGCFQNVLRPPLMALRRMGLVTYRRRVYAVARRAVSP
jgi:hypothetical protein